MVGGEGDAAPCLVEGHRVVPFLSSLTKRCFVRLQATDTDHGAELWRTDGTGPGTVLVKDIYPGERSGGPTFMAPFGGYLFFQVTYWWNPDTIQLLPNAHAVNAIRNISWLCSSFNFLSLKQSNSDFDDALNRGPIGKKQASGVDTGWMLPPDHQDLCAGFRQSSFDTAVFFAVAEVQKLKRNLRVSRFCFRGGLSTQERSISCVSIDLNISANLKRTFGILQVSPTLCSAGSTNPSSAA